MTEVVSNNVRARSSYSLMGLLCCGTIEVDKNCRNSKVGTVGSCFRKK